MSIADLKVRISANADQFDSAMKNMQRSFNKTVRKMERTGRKMTESITVPIAAMAGAAVTASIHFEDAFAGVRKTVDATEKEFQQLRKGILDMSKEMPTSAAEIARVAEAAGQLGIQQDSILEFTRTMVMLGDTTNIAAQEAATSLARVANILEVPSDKFDEMGSVIVDLGNNFATTEAEITDFATRISGAANIAGFATEDVFALGAAFTSVGVEAGVGGTAVQKVLIGINTAVAESNKNLRKFAEVAGMSAQEFQKAWREDAGQAFASFVNGLGEQGDQAAGVLDELGMADQRLVRAFLSLANAGDLVNRTLETGRKAHEENNALVEEANKRYKTMWSRIKMLGNRIYALGVSIGDALMPIVEEAMVFVESLIKSFDSLSAEAKMNVLKIAALFAASGPIMWALAKFARVMSGLASLVKSKFFIIVSAFVSGVTIGQWLVDNWEKIVRKFEMQMIAIETAVTAAVWGMIKSIKAFINFATQMTPPELLTGLFGIDLSEMAFDASGVNKILDSLNQRLTKKGKEFKDATVKYYKKPWTTISESARNGADKIKEAIGNLLGMSIKGTSLEKLLNQMKGSFEDIEQKADDAIKKMKELVLSGGVKFNPLDGMGSNSSSFELPTINFGAAKENIKEKGRELSNATKIALAGSVEAFDEQKEKLKNSAESFASIMEGVFENAIVSFAESIGELAAGASSIQDVAVGLINVLSDMMIQIGALWVAFGTGWSAAMNPATLFASGGTSAIAAGAALIAAGAGLKAIFSDAASRDIGGPAMKDQPYMIGKGPHQELFIPDRSGSIVPNSKLRGMGGGLGSLNIHVTGELRGQGKDLVGVIKGANYRIDR